MICNSQSSAVAGPVLVIDTTTDYIDYIYRQYPGQAVFVTDRDRRRTAVEPAPDNRYEILVGMEDPASVPESVRRHLDSYRIRAAGIACFDCEAMLTASYVARELELPYPSAEAVLASRSKFISKRLWQDAGLDCPAVAQIESPVEAAAFCIKHGKVILKPLCGSGLPVYCAPASRWCAGK